MSADLIIRHTTDMWIVVDSDWSIRFLNPAAENLVHVSQAEALGRHFWEVFPDVVDGGFYREYQQAMISRESRELLAWHAPAGRWLRVCLTPVPETGLAIGLTDVTKAVQTDQERDRLLQRSEERLRLATEAAEVGIWDYLVEENRLICSPLSRRLLGLPESDEGITYELLKSCLHKEDSKRASEAAYRALFQGGDYNSEFRVIWPDHSVHWLAVKGMRATNEQHEPVRFYGTVMDITERKQAEEALVRQADQLVRSNADLQQFAYVTSHDIQEPLRGIASFAQLLSQRYRGQLDSNADEFISYIINGVRRMSELIDDLLIYSRVVNVEQMATSPVDLNGVLHWARMNLQKALEETGGKITQTSLPTLRGDHIKMVQLLQNLLSNAIKYHREGVPPEIRVGAEKQNEEWLLSVQDNGIGIDPQFHERIFGLFKRLHGRDTPGTGIGLAICRKIVEQNGGRIWVESEPGTGSTFFFTLPAD